MTDDAWDDWAGYHSTLHRMTDAAELAMLSLWREVFESHGFEESELREASLHLAKTGSKWRTEHLQGIIDRVSDRRLLRMQAELAEQDRQHQADECKLCGGPGIVCVPHKASVRNGEWVYPWYECGVACWCYRGQRRVASNAETIRVSEDKLRITRKGEVPTRLVTLAEYEMHNPGWESQMQLREIQRESARKARMATATEDRRRGPLAGLVEQLAGDDRRLS